jgi:hypothetical protein
MNRIAQHKNKKYKEGGLSLKYPSKLPKKTEHKAIIFKEEDR